MSITCPKCRSDNPDTLKFCGECGTQLPFIKDIHLEVTETIQAPIKELTPGSTFAGRYQVIEELGHGGMGRVYKVQDTKVGEKIALKLIRPEAGLDKKSLERFSNELKLARKIRHKNVCQMFDLGEDHGTRFLTMEYVHGEDLKQLIRKVGQLSPSQAIGIARQVCDGLEEAHKLGVVHRDLKPQNIMVDDNGKARIMDFGIARSLSGKSITGAGVMIGTPEYMSPEQVEGKEIDQRSDIYSLGVILYEMVTGHLPFIGETPLSIAHKHKYEAPVDPQKVNAQVSDDLARVILKCLAKDESKRIQTAAELGTELGRIEQGLPTTSHEIPKRKTFTSKEITVKFSVKKLLWPALVIIGLVVVGLAVWKYIPKKPISLLPEQKRAIAVISFENQTGDKANDNLGKTIQNLLITNLEQSGYFYVTTRERLRDLLKQLGKGNVEFIDPDLGFELCKMDGVNALVLGSYAQAGNVFVTNAQVLDVGTKNLLGTASSRGEGPESVLNKQIDELSTQIAKNVGLTESKIRASKMQVRDVTTNSPEAYNYYLKAMTEFNLSLDFEKKGQFLKKAIELDPNFGSAYYQLYFVYMNLGDAQKRKETLEKAWGLSKKATEKERLLIGAFYARDIEMNSEKEFLILQEIAAKYPKDKEAYRWMARYYLNRKMLNQAAEEFNKMLGLDPTDEEAMVMLGGIYLDMGDFAKAIECNKKIASVHPGEPNPIDSFAEIYFHMGKIDEAIANYRKALEIKPDFYYSMLPLQYSYALKEDYAEASKWLDKYIETVPSSVKLIGYIWKGFYCSWLGSLDKSMSYFQRAEDLSDAFGHKGRKAFINTLKSWILLDRRELELSRKYNDAWLSLSIEINPANKLFSETCYKCALGLMELEDGKFNSAETRLREIEAALPKLNPAQKERIVFLQNLLGSEVSLAKGSPKEAIDIIGKTLFSPPPLFDVSQSPNLINYNTPFLKDVLARAYAKMGDLDKAIAEYERLIIVDPKSRARFLIHPKYHYRLAKLYDQKGLKSKAVEQYRKFLDLWKDADPGLPDMEDAKSRLEKLKGP